VFKLLDKNTLSLAAAVADVAVVMTLWSVKEQHSNVLVSFPFALGCSWEKQVIKEPSRHV
jgi:hypothetical protein